MFCGYYWVDWVVTQMAPLRHCDVATTKQQILLHSLISLSLSIQAKTKYTAQTVHILRNTNSATHIHMRD